MNALDTNLLARFFIEDTSDPEAPKQKAIATHVMSQPSFVSLTVVLEFVWVMRKGYLLPKETIAKVLIVLCETPHITVERSGYIEEATKLFLQGMDFADALHLLQANTCDRFYTFDKRLVKKSTLLYPQIPAVEPIVPND